MAHTTIDDSHRFDELVDGFLKLIHESNDVCSNLHGWFGSGGKSFEGVRDVRQYVYAPGGVSGKARKIYEVVLDEMDEVVPVGLMEVAVFHDLDVTGIYEKDSRQCLLLEPADTEEYPR